MKEKKNGTGSQSRGPLHGMKVLDMTSLLPGPYATLCLADMGATVLRVNSGTRPDPIESRAPFIPRTKLSAAWAYLGRGKLSINLNLKNPKAIKIIHQLIMEYDVVLEQFRPGVMAKLGLDYDSLKKINPRLIYCSLTGYGQTGPLSQRAGHDINYISLAGLSAYSGRKASGPSLMGMQIADIASGSMNSVIGILAAFIHRKQTGEGQRIDVSMTDGVMAFHILPGSAYLVSGREPGREAERLNGGILYDFYETKDGQYMSVGSLEPQFFKALCEAIGRPDLIPGGVGPQNVDQVKAEVRGLFRSKTQAQWTEIFRNVDACVEPVIGFAEALNGENAQAREMIIELDVPGGGKVKQIANPIKFSQTRQMPGSAGVPSGTHTKEIVQRLGYSEDEFRKLSEEGVFS